MPVIAGGPHVSSRPLEPLGPLAGRRGASGAEALLHTRGNTFNRVLPESFEAFDYAIRHEGEETLRETMQMLESGSDPAAVKGLVFRRNGQVVLNPPRPYIEDLDSLPMPAYDLIPDIGVYRPPPF